jgi:NTE family protein
MTAVAAGRRSQSRIGLALAGGGPEGAVYEIGALRALDEALDGLDLNDLFVAVGVSAGAYVAACLANRLTTAQLCRAIVSREPGEHPFQPQMFFSPAVVELVRRGATVPKRLIAALHEYWTHPEDLTLIESLLALSRALPVGLFDNDPIRRYLAEGFAIKGRTDDFRRLGTRLIIVAADLCSARAACFGTPELDAVPISRAVQASTAFPGLYPPVEIDGRYYVDGVLLKTMHGSSALDQGADLLLAVNPIVPVEVEACGRRGVFEGGSLFDRGLPAVLSQTFRTIIYSRMKLGLDSYRERYPEADVVLFEPDHRDVTMFTTNIFSFSSRKSVLEHAYRATRHTLLERRTELEPVLARHGIRIRHEVLEEERDLWVEVGLRRPPRRRVAERLGSALDRLERVLDRL